MFSNRHHIHLICDFSDVALHSLQDSLFVHFESKAYLTHDLFLMRSESSAYSWQCINACDYTLLLIGDSYGQLANTGVSQLHISYLNARTKQKPMVAFVKKGVGETVPQKSNRQLSDFINLITLQVKDIIYYDDDSDLPALIEDAYQRLQAQSFAVPVSEIVDDHLPIYDITEEEVAVISKQEFVSNPIIPPKSTDRPKNNNAPALGSSIALHCNAHAFQGGTLIEVAFQIQATWQQILSELSALATPFSTQGLWKTLNQIATAQATPIIQADYPEVHAVSRCQVVRSDVLVVQETLLFADWIARSEPNKEIWYLTDTANDIINNP